MKLEKRSSGAPDPSTSEQPQSTTGGRKPVIVYIMILFIAAFLLMALSFLMHQRSNTEVMGKLQDSVSALQEVQAVQNQNMKLQEDLQDTQEQLAQAESDYTDAQNEIEALLQLYTLQQQYANGNYDACRSTLQAMEDADQASSLPTQAQADDVVSPAERYQQLKEAIQSK